ncbi:MAG: glycosyltransferase family 2 protein [Kofleriaceae bacterium]
MRCPACQEDVPSYLFHRAGVRFVRCASCAAVYVNPARTEPVNNLDVDRFHPFANPRDRELMIEDMGALLDRVASDYAKSHAAPLERTLLLGRYLPEFAKLPQAEAVGLQVAQFNDDHFRQLALDSDLAPLAAQLAARPQVVILQELLESCANPDAVMAKLVEALPANTVFIVTYTNADSLPARMLRRHWASFFESKSVYLGTSNLTALLARHGLVLRAQYPLPVTRTVRYVFDMAARVAPALTVAHSFPLQDAAVPLRVGNRVAVFQRNSREAGRAEKLSIVMPVFNEERFAAQVIDAVLAKQLPIDREVIIVESNSTDGTRDIVRRYETVPGVRVVYEEKPRGKGHAVRTGLAHVTGSIVLIQDSDFEYDIEDYDALLEPILQRKTQFVLGSRSLGLDDWKVRKYDTTPIRGVALNFAQVVFAKTYNLLYQQSVTDVNTMFKVFRVECLDGLDLHSNGFELDIELACKLARNGNAAMEVPVNYAARGFEDGKKIRFWRDAIPSYFAFFRYRF